VEPHIEAVFRDADASACPQDTELGGAVAQAARWLMASICATSFTVYTSLVVSGLLVGDLTALV